MSRRRTHNLNYSYEYVDGIVYRTSECNICDAYEIRTEEYFKTDFEEELTYYERENYHDGYTYFQFIPERDGYYNVQFVGNGNRASIRVYSSYFGIMSSGGGSNGYGLRYSFTAGETYYLAVNNAIGYTFTVQYSLAESVDLSEYGCACGGTLEIYHPLNNYTNYNVTFNCSTEYNYEFGYNYCTVCGFAYTTTTDYMTDESCNEIREDYFLVGTNGNPVDTFERILIASYKTGTVRHNTTASASLSMRSS